MRTMRALLVAAGLALGASGAQAATVSFDNLGTFTTPALNQGGVTVTGSADVNVLNLNGLGIVGGGFNETVDGSEFITFTFAQPAINVSFHVPFGGNGDGDFLVGERTLDVFAPGGASLGSFAQNNVGFFVVSSLVANAAIGSFRLSAFDGDRFRIGSVTYDAAPAEVPVPAALPLFASGLGALGLIGWRRKRKAQAAA